ncbi:MAG: DUF1549 domain-containing protein [Planctomycetes bacterium]|nr:DUF1549 domain-containing protein [Planctomycetota bacterium]
MEVFPGSIQIHGPQDFQRLVVMGVSEKGKTADLTAAATFTLDDPKIARIEPLASEGGRPAVFPQADGETRLKVALKSAAAGDRSLEVPIRVQGLSNPQPPRFAHDVVAALTRLGCNSGSCHGSQYGKGGFKLSLLGYEPDEDLVAIGREAGARRVVPIDPPRSLILLKPALAVPHGGGKRLDPNSREYRTLASWIEAGVPGPPSSGNSQVESVRVFPEAMLLQPGEKQGLLVLARLSSGQEEDVTGKALLASLNDGVAAVDLAANGVAANGPGETAVMVRYQGQATVARVTVPYRDLSSEAVAFPANNFIDSLVAKKWITLGLVPSDRCTDAEFIRRVYIDAIGTQPAVEESAAFLSDPAPDKREKLIDRVLDRPEYVDYWALKWGDILRINRANLGEKGMWSFYNWVRAALRENRPLDQMVTELITAQGSTFTTGPANYFRIAQTPNDLAETTCQVFLGIRMQCAQCHHHPFEKWTQDDYFGMAAYFARLGLKGSSEFGLYGDERVVFVKKGGEVSHPKTGKALVPKPLEAAPADDPADRRRALARWLAAKDNQLFARNFANRFWGYLMGRGLVEPVDDVRVTNPPSNPELLEALAGEFSRGGFNQKELMRTILRSCAYQLSSWPVEWNRGDDTFYSHYLVRRLPAEVLLDAAVAATGVPESFSGLPKGTRAIQLPDADFNSYLLKTFGKPKREITCECERVGLPNMAQALHLMNGDFIQSRLISSSGRVARLLKENKSDEEIIREFYLATVCRLPAENEVHNARSFIQAAPSRKEGVEDVLWSLCNAKEFLFNH